MNREEVRKAAEVMLAFADGKEIQYSNKGQNNWLNWVNDSAPHFDWERVDYRIKPEPKYRPFLNQEECWEEMHKHPDFGWIVSKEGLEFSHICDIFTSASKRLMITLGIDENNSFEADRYFNNFTFTDGEPFGVKEE